MGRQPCELHELKQRAREEIESNDSLRGFRDVLMEVLENGYAERGRELYVLCFYEDRWIKHIVKDEGVSGATIYSYERDPWCALWVVRITPDSELARVVLYRSPTVPLLGSGGVYETWTYKYGKWSTTWKKERCDFVDFLDCEMFCGMRGYGEDQHDWCMERCLEKRRGGNLYV